MTEINQLIQSAYNAASNLSPLSKIAVAGAIVSYSLPIGGAMAAIGTLAAIYAAGKLAQSCQKSTTRHVYHFGGTQPITVNMMNGSIRDIEGLTAENQRFLPQILEGLGIANQNSRVDQPRNTTAHESLPPLERAESVANEAPPAYDQLPPAYQPPPETAPGFDQNLAEERKEESRNQESPRVKCEECDPLPQVKQEDFS